MPRDAPPSALRAWLRRRAWPRLGSVLDDVPVPMIVVDEGLRVLSCSRTAGALLGWSPYAAIGKPVGVVLPGVEPPDPEASPSRQVVPGSPGMTVSWAWSTAGGRVTGVAVLDQDDATRSDERLLHAAQHDALTGLWNRATLEEQLVELVSADAPSLAVLFLDLDRFKVINDSLGHAAGDQLLVEVSARLRAAVRPDDLVARFGGDEFVVVCPHVDSVNAVTSVAKRILSALDEPVELSGTTVRSQGSIGLALGTGTDDAAELLRNADTALYRAKERGRGRYVIFDPQLQAEARERLALEVGLRRAVEDEALHVAYQPIVALADRRVVGVEALARWTDPELGVVGPERFIPVAEESGLVHGLGRFVLRDACRLLAQLQDECGATAPYVSVNVSGSQFALHGFVDVVASELAAAGARGGGLVVELTELVLLHDTHRHIDTLRRLRALGVRIALDDFGTGHSSLTYLRRFPVDIVKVDRSFVMAIATDPGDRAIVAALVGLSQALELQVVAEGIETEDDVRALDAVGCQLGQGYLLGRPLPSSVLFERLGERGQVQRPAA